MNKEYKKHYSVLYRECLEHLTHAHKPNPLYVDLTFGAGGHSFGLAQSSEDAKVISTDQDPDAYLNGTRNIQEKGLQDKMRLVKINFSEFPDWFDQNCAGESIDGVLMDLGVSSHQFDEFSRGFSFREDAPLDMRMAYDDESRPTAADFLNTADEETIANIIFKYGEDRLSRKIAAQIVVERSKAPIKTTGQLENICFHAYPAKMRHGRTHPATRTFQALRIHVNRELEVLEDSIEKLFELLGEQGRLAIISFHSLEDRIVKHKFKEIFQNNKNIAKIITKRPITPAQDELDENSRSRSAKLRVIEKNSMEGNNGKKSKSYTKEKFR